MVEAENRLSKSQPYGNGPLLLGVHAYDFLYDLCYDVPTVPEEGRGRWIKSDKWAFHNWRSMEEHIPAALSEPGLDATQVENVIGSLTDIHVALPYDEAERSWLSAAYCEAYDEAGAASIGVIRQRQAEEIMAGGLRRVIDGRDLMRRWWAWRRQTNEFTGQGSLSIARQALRSLIETVAPSELAAADTAIEHAQQS
jgi:hypothetical protein